MPPVTGKQLIAILKKLGYSLVRVRGSHHRFHGPQGQIVIVPLHANREIAKGTLHYTITKMMGMTIEEFLALRKGK